MQDTLESKLELFNSFSQPVILVREGKVVYANHAAAACGIDAAQDAGEFVEEADEGLRRHSWISSRPLRSALYRARSGTSFPTPYSTSPTNTGRARGFRPTRS